MTQIEYATSERIENSRGLEIFKPRALERNFKDGTNDPFFIYQYNGKKYFLDGVPTGESCQTPVIIVQEATHKRCKELHKKQA